MKHVLLFLLCIPLLAFGQIKADQLVKKNGLFYQTGSSTPFTGKVMSYFPNGDIQQWVEYKDGRMNGQLVSFYKKDVKQIEGFVENGKKTGVWKLYSEKGLLRKQTSYQNDKENGTESFWFENGKLQKTGSYKDGKLNGKYEWYFENGQKKQEGYYVEGKEDSTWTEWFSTGTQKMKGHFTHFERHGTWTWWDESGKVVSSKKYIHGLVSVEKDNFNTYIEKMEYYLRHRNYTESVKNIQLAEATIANKTESNPIYMGVQVYHSRCYSLFSHYKQGEAILLKTLGLDTKQMAVIQEYPVTQSAEKITQLIQELNQKDQKTPTISTHIVLSLCYNLIGDTLHVRDEQQLMMEKGGMQDWIINVSMELYKLSGARFTHYQGLAHIQQQLSKEQMTEKLELEKAHWLLRTEQFKEANAILEKYLAQHENNVQALLLKADIEMAYGNVEQMKKYEAKVLSIDPTALSGL